MNSSNPYFNAYKNSILSSSNVNNTTTNSNGFTNINSDYKLPFNLPNNQNNNVPLGYNAGSYIPPTKQSDQTIKTKSVPSKNNKQNTIIRSAGGQVWEDRTLLDWDPNDYRLFVGNLGREVNDDLLCRAFNTYKSLSKAKVIKSNVNGRSKGYGFVSFKESKDFLRAWHKFIGSRPVMLKRSNWKERNIVGPKDTFKSNKHK